MVQRFPVSAMGHDCNAGSDKCLCLFTNESCGFTGGTFLAPAFGSVVLLATVDCYVESVAECIEERGFQHVVEQAGKRHVGWMWLGSLNTKATFAKELPPSTVEQ